MSNEFKPGVTVKNAPSQENVEDGAVSKVEEREFSEKETANQMRMHEEDFIQGLIDAAGYTQEEHQIIEIARRDTKTGDSRVYFRFSIRPLSEREYEKCKKKNTKYVRNKRIGMSMPSDTDNVKYRDMLIYEATIPEDREKLWDNKKVWDAMRNNGLQIMNGLDVIEYSLIAGEKEKIVEQIDRISGFEDDSLEEVTKN